MHADNWADDLTILIPLGPGGQTIITLAPRLAPTPPFRGAGRSRVAQADVPLAIESPAANLPLLSQEYDPPTLRIRDRILERPANDLGISLPNLFETHRITTVASAKEADRLDVLPAPEYEFRFSLPLHLK